MSKDYIQITKDALLGALSNIEQYGNTTAASIPIAMTEAYEKGLIKEGSLICLVAFGSGFTWGANLIRF